MRRNRIAGHIAIFSGIRFLGDGQPPSSFDGFQPQAAIAACSGEDDANGTLSLIFGQGAEKEVDWQAMLSPGFRFDEPQLPAAQGQVAAWRDNIHLVGLYLDAIRYLRDGHGSVALEDFRQDRFMRW